ncbi:hypothetical protein SDC9_51693 [bioreactor metagenome]|uniref:HTH cro/C1-type domain-containing protein n=1 Tax=bioreactor metagenome TaxID=1076179 RepID=A0A644WTA5_9ZZZZ
MSIGNRISELRRKNNFSQEYIAEQLNVSRQAVSKWESGRSNPDTENLIRLAELLNVSVEYLSKGKVNPPPVAAEKEAGRKRLNKKHVVMILSTLAICVLITGAVRIYTLPVDWDAGACSGGYATFVFDKYGERLVQKYLDGSDRKDGIISLEAVEGTQEAEWQDRTIYLHFDITYHHNVEGTVTESLTFTGHRIWFDTYKWGGAMIAG